jgi:hypothetical protein
MDRTTRWFDLLLRDEPLALDLSTLYARLPLVPDQRARRGVRYALPLLLMIALLAKLRGQHHVRAIAAWAALRATALAQVLPFARATMPHHTTWSRIVGTAVDHTTLDQVLRGVLYPADGAVPGEERILTTSSMLADDRRWPYLAQVLTLESHVTTARGTHSTVRYGVTSVPVRVADARRLLTLVRGHWGIEHGLHERGDAPLAEDRALVRRGQAPRTLATLNNTVLTLFARHKQRNVPKAQRTFSYHLERALARLSCT